jgi:hypothetical protein
LDPAQQAAIDNCKAESSSNRPYLFTFTGNFRHSVRQALQPLHNGKDVIIQSHYDGGENNLTTSKFDNAQGKYTKLLTQSLFGAAPRGDNLYTYRFGEILSAGAIPVVYADEWVLPFGPQLVDWNEWVVRIPERDAARTLDYLGNITNAKRCVMRQTAYKFWKTYMATGKGIVQGIVESLERAR